MKGEGGRRGDGPLGQQGVVIELLGLKMLLNVISSFTLFNRMNLCIRILKNCLIIHLGQNTRKITRNNSGKQRSVNFIHLIINKIDLWNHGPIYLISLYVLFSQRRTQGNLVNYANLCMVKGRNFQERVL